MTTEIKDFVGLLHRQPARLVLAVTGGGSLAIPQLLSVPGASNTVLEAAVPYASERATAWLGVAPEQHCSDRTARAMAMVAFHDAVGYGADLDIDADQLAGIACTASLATDRPKRGAHRAYIALQTAAATASYAIELVKSARDRASEEELVARILLNVVAEAKGISERLLLDLLQSETLLTQSIQGPPAWRELMLGRSRLASAIGSASDANTSKADRSRAIFPGAFNPLHDGHRRMAEIASQRLHLPVEFEISVTNVDKPPLDYIEMTERAKQFGPTDTLWFSRAATFFEKSSIFPGATFVVGADTLARIGNARYYGGNAAACRQTIDEIAVRRCRFLVFARRIDGAVRPLADLGLPDNLLRISQEVPAETFCQDISSTELRREE